MKDFSHMIAFACSNSHVLNITKVWSYESQDKIGFEIYLFIYFCVFERLAFDQT